MASAQAQSDARDPDFALMLVAPDRCRWRELISRASYEMVAGATGCTVRLPLCGRFDENDAILVMDNVLIRGKTY
ncbi:hypothetical protein ACNKHV_27430 [Shigella flexneri]